jgi:hypothetical protein
MQVMRPLLRLALAAALALSSTALAQRASHFSAFGGGPLPTGTSMLHAQFGWPGISATFLTGATPRASLGGRFTFNYSREGQASGILLGLKFQGLMRLGLVDTGRVNFGLELAPGFAMYFPGTGAFAYTELGLALPVAFVLGIPFSDALALHVALELPMLVTFNGYPTLYLPIYMGGGLEYALDRNLYVTLALRMGPMIDVRLNRPAFGLEGLFGLAFRF